MPAVPQEELLFWEDVEEAAGAQANSMWLKPRRLVAAMVLVFGFVVAGTCLRKGSPNVAATQEIDQLDLLGKLRDDGRGKFDPMSKLRDVGGDGRFHGGDMMGDRMRTSPARTANAAGSCDSMCTSTASGCNGQCSTNSVSCNTQCSSGQWASDPAKNEKHIQTCQKHCQKDQDKCSKTCTKELKECNKACKTSK